MYSNDLDQILLVHNADGVNIDTPKLILLLYADDGMLARVQNDGEFSDPFPVTIEFSKAVY